MTVTPRWISKYSVLKTLINWILASDQQPPRIGREFNALVKPLSVYAAVPEAGDIFKIITVRDSILGKFSNFNDGDVVVQIGGINLVINLRGGDGNDVVLTGIGSGSGSGFGAPAPAPAPSAATTPSAIPTLNIWSLITPIFFVIIIVQIPLRRRVDRQ